MSMRSFSEHWDYVFSLKEGMAELSTMVDLVTTNKTDFFREPMHFEYLFEKTLPELAANNKKKVRLWSAGCSTGEEPYTLAMVLSEFAERHRGFFFSILATDLSGHALETAKSGVYEMERAGPVPWEFKKKYLLKSKDPKRGLVRIAPELRYLVEFRRLNLMDMDYGLRESVDIIFCRNVIIYFDRDTQEKLVNRFWRSLAPGGYLFIGHSESLSSLDVPMSMAAPTICKKF